MYKLIVERTDKEIPEVTTLEIEKKGMAKAIKSSLELIGFKVNATRDIEF